MNNEVKYLIAVGGFSFMAIAITMADFLSAFTRGFITVILLIVTVIVINTKKWEDD